MIRVDLAVFAHNESENINSLITMLSKQTVFDMEDISLNVSVLANGCIDNTFKVAEQCIHINSLTDFKTYNLELAGKSRTWNYFVHELSRKDADVLIFCDSDIDIPVTSVLEKLIYLLLENASLSGLSSRPIKDISLENRDDLSLLDKIIATAAGGLNNWKHSICGQLYLLKTACARKFYLPIGLPVEDGFVRAMLLTESFCIKEDINKLYGYDELFHIYRSERTIRALIKHQTRIVIGSAINTVIYEYLRSLTPDKRNEALLESSLDEKWLTQLVHSKLPCWKYGWVPLSFLTKRIQHTITQPKRLFQPRTISLLILGGGFDVIVYLNAQIKMARGVGVGHW